MASQGLGIGIIGTGWGARVQAPIFCAAGLEVVAIAGRDEAKTVRIAGELQIPRAMTDWQRLVELPEVNVVSIVTPPNQHLEMALAAIEAGKHVLAEKPTAMDAGEARRMWDAARARPELLTLIDHELRFLPTMRRARDLIGAQLGAVRHVHIVGVSRGRSDPNVPWNWWSDLEQGGGLLGASASHQVDTLRYLCGAEVAWVHAILETFVKERPHPDGGRRAVTADDFFALHLGLRGGGYGLLTGSSVAGANEPPSFTVHCERGAVRITEGKLLVAREGSSYQEEARVDVTLPEGVPGGDFPQGTVYLARALKAALEGDRSEIALAATFEDGFLNQQVLDAARRSAREGTRVTIG